MFLKLRLTPLFLSDNLLTAEEFHATEQTTKLLLLLFFEFKYTEKWLTQLEQASVLQDNYYQITSQIFFPIQNLLESGRGKWVNHSDGCYM